MKKKYSKPVTQVYKLQARMNLLEGSPLPNPYDELGGMGFPQF